MKVSSTQGRTPEPGKNGAPTASVVTAPPAFLWWRDTDFRWDIELRSEVVVKLGDHTGAICVLAGFLNEDAGVFEFHVWDCIPLAAKTKADITPSALRLLKESSLNIGFSILGFSLPDPVLSPEEILPGISPCADMLPAAALVFCARQNELLDVFGWTKSKATIEQLTLQFRPDLPSLARDGYAPFQPLHIGSDRSTGEEPDEPNETDEQVEADAYPTKLLPPVLQPAPVAGPAATTVVKLEVPSWLWLSGMASLAGMAAVGAWYIHQQ